MMLLLLATALMLAVCHADGDPRSVCRYTVVSKAAMDTHYAAELLSRWLSAAGRCSVPFATGRSTADPQIAVAVDTTLPAEAVSLQTFGSAEAVSYRVAGGSSRGAAYGAYELLERVAGFEFFGRNATLVPQLTALAQRPLGWRFSTQPAFEFRSIGFAEVLRESGSELAVAMRDNSIDWKNDPKPGGGVYYANPPGGVHSAFLLIPPAKYQEVHPEWFGGYVVDASGKRVATQLCWSAPGLVDQLLDAVRTDLRFSVNDNASVVSVSQNDGGTFCNSSAELAVINEEGSPAGPLLRAVNAVADGIAAEFPHVYLDTLAYMFTLKPPRLTRPRPNVIIRIGTMGSNFRFPLDHDENSAVRDAIVSWSRIAPRVWVWDYLVNFPNYVSPWPNYGVIGPNVKFLRSLNVSGIYEEGDGYARGSDLAELKTWLVGKLLWDPSQDSKVLTWRFLEGYYGVAVAPLILEYMQLFEGAAQTTGTVLDPEDNCIPGPPTCVGKMEYLKPETLLRSAAIFQRAAQVVDNDESRRLRLAAAELPTLYVILLRWDYVRALAEKNGTTHAWPQALSTNISVVYERFAATYRARGMDQCVWCENPGERCASPQRDNALGEWTGAGLKWFKKQIGA